MKHTMKRSLSLVLALCMVLGLVVLPGVTEAKAEDTDLITYHPMSESAGESAQYRASGFAKVKSKTEITGGGIITEANGNKYWDLRMASNATAVSWVSYANASMDKTTVLKYRILLDESTANLTFYPLTLANSGSGRNVGITIANNKVTISTTSKALSTGVWHDLEIVVNGNALTIYVDNEYFYNTASYKNLTSLTTLGYITSYFNANPGAGYGIDDMYVYNYVAGTTLTAVENSYSVTVGDVVSNIWTKNQDNYLPALSFKSSDENVAIVDADGVVTTVGSGEATITATYALPGTANMGKATTTITVTERQAEQPELKFSTAAPVLENNLAILFKADASLFTTDGYSEPYATFQFDGSTYTVSDYTVEGDKYVFKFSGIAPHQMGDEITYTLHATYDGEPVSSQAKTYSILTYCNYYLTGDNEALKTLLVDTLNYGAAAQNYKNYKTDALVNADLSEEQKNFAAPTLENETAQSGEATVATWTNAALVLDNAITVRLKFQTEADISGLTVKVNGAEVAISGTANNYYVDYNDLDAGQLRNEITAEIYQGETLVSKTLTFSAEYYAAYQAQNSTDANLVALVKAMMKYGDSAAAFENN